MHLNKYFVLALSLAIVFVLSADVFAQGKGKGSGGGNGKGNGQSQGKSNHDDDTWDRDGDKGNGKSKNGGLTGSDNRFKGLSKKLGRSPESLRDWYNAERAVNPRLNYGQFVAANMVARNHNMSPETFLRGFRRGQSIGQTLKASGWSDDRISGERRRLKDMRGDGWQDYVDRAVDWAY